MVDISFKSRYIYVDVGARSYGSSIGSWFKKQYPKQNKTFEVYAKMVDVWAGWIQGMESIQITWLSRDSQWLLLTVKP